MATVSLTSNRTRKTQSLTRGYSRQQLPLRRA